MLLEYRENMTAEQHDAWHEIKEIEKWFTDRDYIANKIVFGEWSKADPRYVDYVLERGVKRARLDYLLSLF